MAIDPVATREVDGEADHERLGEHEQGFTHEASTITVEQDEAVDCPRTRLRGSRSLPSGWRSPRQGCPAPLAQTIGRLSSMRLVRASVRCDSPTYTSVRRLESRPEKSVDEHPSTLENGRLRRANPSRALREACCWGRRAAGGMRDRCRTPRSDARRALARRDRHGARDLPADSRARCTRSSKESRRRRRSFCSPGPPTEQRLG